MHSEVHVCPLILCHRRRSCIVVASGANHSHELQQHLDHLLGEHLIVPPDSAGLEVGVAELDEAGADQEAVPAARLAAVLYPVGGEGCAVRLQGRRRGVHVGDDRLGCAGNW